MNINQFIGLLWIKSFIHYGANAVHLSYCMLVLCPFVKKYTKVIKEEFPEIELVLGTHEPHQTNDEFKCAGKSF